MILDNLLGVFDAKAAGHELGEEGVAEGGEDLGFCQSSIGSLFQGIEICAEPLLPHPIGQSDLHTAELSSAKLCLPSTSFAHLLDLRLSKKQSEPRTDGIHARFIKAHDRNVRVDSRRVIGGPSRDSTKGPDTRGINQYVVSVEQLRSLNFLRQGSTRRGKVHTSVTDTFLVQNHEIIAGF